LKEIEQIEDVDFAEATDILMKKINPVNTFLSLNVDHYKIFS